MLDRALRHHDNTVSPASEKPDYGEPMPTNLAQRQQTHFVLWRPAQTVPAPRLVIGQFKSGNPPTLVHRQDFPLAAVAGFPDLWAIAANQCNLTDGQVYHYWFEVDDSSLGRDPTTRIRCTDPTAWTVDWRLLAPKPPGPYSADDQDPAGVVLFKGGPLVACDPGGEIPDWTDDTPLDTRPTPAPPTSSRAGRTRRPATAGARSPRTASSRPSGSAVSRSSPGRRRSTPWSPPSRTASTQTRPRQRLRSSARPDQRRLGLR